MSKLLSQRKVTGLAIGTGVLLAGLATGEARAQFEEFLLPDMMPWISDSNGYSHGWRLNFSETEFSATTTPLNTGEGHLEVHDDLDQSGTGNNDIDIYQRLYRPDGTHEDFLAGNFINHPNHGHFHFEGYSVQRIREVGPGNSIGDVVATGEKTSFCMIDLASFGGSANYFGCGRGTQGISAGYGDVYSSGLDGQQIDVSNLPRSGGNFTGGLNGSGVYWFEIIIDPDNAMIESNNHNNFAHLLIDLNGSEGAVLDDHANSRANATVLQHGNGTFDATSLPAGYRFGEIGQEGDVDFFSAEVREGALYMISIEELQMEYSDIKIEGTQNTQVFYQNLGSSGQQTAEYEFRADGDGDYYIEVGETRSSFGNRDGSYMVHFELLRIAGDANGDDVVDTEDLDMLLATWGDTVAARSGADFNGDGTIDGADQDILVASFGDTRADYSTAVPEPGSLAVLGLGGLAMLRRRR
ncbi:MAG: lysyl oxidase family protein [Planctomycetota bacterium]